MAKRMKSLKYTQNAVRKIRQHLKAVDRHLNAVLWYAARAVKHYPAKKR